MSPIKWINIGLRGLMEAGIVISFSYWGYHLVENSTLKIVLAVVIPLVGFGFWGLVDFHQLKKASETLRLIQELIISGLAAVALYSTGAHILGWCLGVLSILHHALTYILGDRLIKQRTR